MKHRIRGQVLLSWHFGALTWIRDNCNLWVVCLSFLTVTHCVEGACCQMLPPQDVYVCSWFMSEYFGMSRRSDWGKAACHHCADFISVMLKWNAGLCSSSLSWWDNAIYAMDAFLWVLFPTLNSDLLGMNSEKRWACSLFQTETCLCLIEIQLVLLLVPFIRIYCLNFGIANWIDSREEQDNRKKNQRWEIKFEIQGSLSPVGWDDPRIANLFSDVWQTEAIRR